MMCQSDHAEDPEQDPDATTVDATGSSDVAGGRYVLLRRHASGGLGEVWIARDTELNNREVAVKRLRERSDFDPQSQARFLLEAEVTGGLEHPGIVPVYSLGTYDNGRPYYAMRFIRGDTLKEVIHHFHADGALTKRSGKRLVELQKLLRRFTDVCNAIDYAHSRGVLHRDIKPSNVIVGKHGETLIVDWGLAKPLREVESGSQSAERVLVPSVAMTAVETLSGAALGTPAYMSPEQAEGNLRRSDLEAMSTASVPHSTVCLLASRRLRARMLVPFSVPFRLADFADLGNSIHRSAGRLRRSASRRWPLNRRTVMQRLGLWLMTSTVM